MAQYDFKTLSSYDFEILVRDLLQKELGLTFESFISGKDKGIDLRYSKNNENSIIVQCKHYANSKFSDLKSTAAKELEKVKLLKCERYILVTSMGLNPGQKKELIDILAPYCNGTSDIYDMELLNNLITKYPEVEKSNFKLWITSVAVLERLIHSGLYNRTQFELEKISEKSKYYVVNKSYDKAFSLLQEFNYCIISGIPGIGKTTLAEILLLTYMEKGYHIYKIQNNIKEAYELYNSEEKQLFYYDDFLGQTTLQEKFSKNEDADLVDFIKSIANKKNKKFILTTREYILNQAKKDYEKLFLSKIDVNKCVISIEDYTRIDRANILYNHIYFSDLPYEIKENILSEQNYLRILDHKNYNPRIIESLTINYSNSLNENYVEHFIEILDNPEELWKHPFENQIGCNSQDLLMILVFLNGNVDEDSLEEAFWKYRKNKLTKYGTNISERDFNNALKELDGTFISSERDIRNSNINIKFNNPSIRDFLEVYIIKSINYEIVLFLESFIYFKQIQSMDFIKKKNPKVYYEVIKRHINIYKSTIKRIFQSNIPSQTYYLSWNLRYLVGNFADLNVRAEELITELLNCVVGDLKFEEIKIFIKLREYLVENNYYIKVNNEEVKKIKDLIFAENYYLLNSFMVFNNTLDFFSENNVIIDSDEIKFVEEQFKSFCENDMEDEIRGLNDIDDLKNYGSDYDKLSLLLKYKYEYATDMIESAIDWREQVNEELDGREDYTERQQFNSRKKVQMEKIEEDSIIQNMFETIM